MKSIDEIRQQLQLGKFEFIRHGLKRLVERNISCLEIMETGKNAVIIEDYPDDKYSPSCLLLGLTVKNVFYIYKSQNRIPIFSLLSLYTNQIQYNGLIILRGGHHEKMSYLWQ